MLFHYLAILIFAAVTIMAAAIDKESKQDSFTATHKSCLCQSQQRVGLVDIFTIRRYGLPSNLEDGKPIQKGEFVHEWSETCFEPRMNEFLATSDRACYKQRKPKNYAWCHKEEKDDGGATVCYNPYSVEWDYQEKGQGKAQILRTKNVRGKRNKWVTITWLDEVTCTDICRTHTRAEDWPGELLGQVEGVCRRFKDDSAHIDSYAAYIDPATSKWHIQKGGHTERNGCQWIEFKKLEKQSKSFWGGVGKNGTIRFP